jgi:TonB family protein
VAKQYFEAITAVFYRAWQQPSRREAGGGAPVVSVNLVIARDGRILNWSMARASKNAVMNKSVIRAVNSVKRLPQFSDYNLGGSQMSVDINFQLD